jgi:hypothetical protein
VVCGAGGSFSDRGTDNLRDTAFLKHPLPDTLGIALGIVLGIVLGTALGTALGMALALGASIESGLSKQTFTLRMWQIWCR